MSVPYKLAGREETPSDLIVEVAGLRFGGPDLIVIAGPCAVEGEETYLRSAQTVQAAGARMLRAPTWSMSATSATASSSRRSRTSVTTGSPVRRLASARMRSPSFPRPWKL